MKQLPIPEPGSFKAELYVSEHLHDLFVGDIRASSKLRGGRTAALAALQSLDEDAYVQHRQVVFPAAKRHDFVVPAYLGAGLLSLEEVWKATKGYSDNAKRVIRAELLEVEYARHWYMTYSSQLADGFRAEFKETDLVNDSLDSSMGCVELTVSELVEDGWLSSQQLEWFISLWVGAGKTLQSGIDFMTQHLIGEDSAANTYIWQKVSGLLNQDPFRLTRWEVERQAQGLCASCELSAACPIETELKLPELISKEPGAASSRVSSSLDTVEVDAVLITTEHLSGAQAGIVNPDKRCIFVFDENQAGKRSAKQAIFWLESLAELALISPLEIYRGDLGSVLELYRRDGISVAANQRLGHQEQSLLLGHVSQVHPWPWLVEPNDGDCSTFEAWTHSHKIGVGSDLI